MNAKIHTTRLNKWGNNTLVYAKLSTYRPGQYDAVTYGNRTQATKKMNELLAAGVNCYIYQGHCFYVAIKE